MRDGDELLRAERPVLITIDESQAIIFSLTQLINKAAEEGNDSIAVRLYDIHERVRAAYTPEEWEFYSKMITQATNEGET